MEVNFLLKLIPEELVFLKEESKRTGKKYDGQRKLIDLEDFWNRINKDNLSLKDLQALEKSM